MPMTMIRSLLRLRLPLAALILTSFACPACSEAGGRSSPDGVSPARTDDAGAENGKLLDGGPDATPDADADADAGRSPSPWITHFDNGSPALLATGPCAPSTGKTTRSYQRYWHDDFTKAAQLPDEYFTVASDLTRINEEQQHYSPGQVTVDAEGLHLTARRVAPFTGKDGKSYTYRSGEVFTNDNSDALDVAYQRYGRWEVCAKLPAARGSWPAIWLLRSTPSSPPGNVPWPPEIDIMEHVGGTDEIQTNIFWGTSAQPKSAEARHTGMPEGGVGTFHAYAVEFDANQVDYFVDGTKIRTYDAAANIPSVPMYLVLNLAVGGVLPSYRPPCDSPKPGVNMTCADGVAAYDAGVQMIVTYARMYY